MYMIYMSMVLYMYKYILSPYLSVDSQDVITQFQIVYVNRNPGGISGLKFDSLLAIV